MLHWLKSVFCLCPIWRFPFKNSISYFNFIKHTYQWGSCHSSVNQINCLNQMSAEKNMLNPPRLNDLCKKQRIQSMIQKITWTSTDMLRLCFSDAHNHTSFKKPNGIKFCPVNLRETIRSNQRTTFRRRHKNTLTTSRHLAANRSYPALVARHSFWNFNPAQRLEDNASWGEGEGCPAGVNQREFFGEGEAGWGSCNHMWRWCCRVGPLDSLQLRPAGTGWLTCSNKPPPLSVWECALHVYVRIGATAMCRAL